MTDLDQEGISGRLRARFSTYQEAPPRRRYALLGLALVALLAIAYGIYTWYYWRHHISTDDAYITAHIAPMSARVPGIVVEVAVNDNQDVKPDQVLVRLDPRDYEVAVAQARAAVVSAKGDLQNAVVSVPLTDDSTRSLVQQADAALGATQHGTEMARQDLEQRLAEIQSRLAAVAAAEAAVRSAQADYDRAKLDRDRIAALVKRPAGGPAGDGPRGGHLPHRGGRARRGPQAPRPGAQRRRSRPRLRSARSRPRSPSRCAGSTRAARRSRTRAASASRCGCARPRWRRRQGRLAQAIANLQQAELNLVYCTIRAPMAGRVSRKSVELGQVVTAGQALLAVVDLDDVWVLANYKETELTDVRPGQPATVTVDTYPGKKFRARVDSIQAGSGAVFSLLPPENATGNFVKVVQRVPVKLVFEPGENAQHLLGARHVRRPDHLHPSDEDRRAPDSRRRALPRDARRRARGRGVRLRRGLDLGSPPRSRRGGRGRRARGVDRRSPRSPRPRGASPSARSC